jgi:predicted lipoprotein with Yx(FWY)xxD motif
MPPMWTVDARDNGRRRRLRAGLVAGVAAAATVAAAGVGLAIVPVTLKVSRNPTLGRAIAVDSRGLTVYELRPETIHHLLCRKASGCFRAWPPVLVGSRAGRLVAAPGIRGRLGTIRRNGLRQLTLGGRPLYRFAGDGGVRGRVNGQGIRSFGGTWHVVTAASPTGW